MFTFRDLAFVGGLVVSNYDADAAAYISAVETADGQSLETDVKNAIDAFVVGCKSDGTWNAIKASCILAGARTLSGALVPLVGTAPTNNNFVSGDYNRKTGLVGNGTTKYLNTNRANNTDPQNSQHFTVYTTINSSNADVAVLIGDLTSGQSGASYVYDYFKSYPVFTSRSTTEATAINATTAGFRGVSRSSSASFNWRASTLSGTPSTSSNTPTTGNLHVFRVNRSLNNLYSNARIAFYSVGESLTLSALESRITTLINAFAIAIP